jgi:hypothetical protein
MARMAPAEETTFPPPHWRAENLQQLRRIWHDLRPEEDDPGAVRKLRGQELTPEQAGAVFERWVMEAFRLSGHTGHYAFTVSMQESATTREQIDGLVLDGWQCFLVESKFWTNKVDFGPIALLHTLLGTRPVGTLGVFFSAFGYTQPALESTDRLHPVRTLLFDQEDLNWALARKPFKGSMLELVRRKWLFAAMNACCSMPLVVPINLFNL